MPLRFEISKEDFEQLEDGIKGLYQAHGDGYRLAVEGIDPADELKEALRKEREERAAAKRKLQEFETEAERRERERLEKQQEWETLARTERERANEREKELQELKDKVANSERTTTAEGVVAGLIDKEATGGVQRYGLLRKEALQFISHTPEGIKINGPDGEAWDAKQLGEYLTNTYPFLVDGRKSSGGGAPGSQSGGAAAKKPFREMTEAERLQFKKDDPDGFYKALRGK